MIDSNWSMFYGLRAPHRVKIMRTVGSSSNLFTSRNICVALYDNFLFKAPEPRVALGVFRYALSDTGPLFFYSSHQTYHFKNICVSIFVATLIIIFLHLYTRNLRVRALFDLGKSADGRSEEGLRIVRISSQFKSAFPQHPR